MTVTGTVAPPQGQQLRVVIMQRCSNQLDLSKSTRDGDNFTANCLLALFAGSKNAALVAYSPAR